VNKKTDKPLAGKRLAGAIVAAAQEKLAEKTAVIDCRGVAATADYFIICQSDTTVQNRAIADGIIGSCAEKNTRPWHSEGEQEGRWILIDFSDVVVHIMLSDLRAYYRLDTLWPDAKSVDITGS
jgi:ribosome-associated protein